jgi:hypothetical protein
VLSEGGTFFGNSGAFPAVRKPKEAKMDSNMVEQLKMALAEKEREAEALRTAIQVLSGEAIQRVMSTAGQRTDYQDLGVTAAAKRFLREMPEPQDTRAIADALLKRGLTTSSRNFVATVYATLNNGKMFKRTKDNRWELVEGEEA